MISRQSFNPASGLTYCSAKFIRKSSPGAIFDTYVVVETNT